MRDLTFHTHGSLKVTRPRGLLCCHVPFSKVPLATTGNISKTPSWGLTAIPKTSFNAVPSPMSNRLSADASNKQYNPLIGRTTCQFSFPSFFSMMMKPITFSNKMRSISLKAAQLFDLNWNVWKWLCPRAGYLRRTYSRGHDVNLLANRVLQDSAFDMRVCTVLEEILVFRIEDLGQCSSWNNSDAYIMHLFWVA